MTSSALTRDFFETLKNRCEMTHRFFVKFLQSEVSYEGKFASQVKFSLGK